MKDIYRHWMGIQQNPELRSSETTDNWIIDQKSCMTKRYLVLALEKSGIGQA